MLHCRFRSTTPDCPESVRRLGFLSASKYHGRGHDNENSAFTCIYTWKSRSTQNHGCDAYSIIKQRDKINIEHGVFDSRVSMAYFTFATLERVHSCHGLVITICRCLTMPLVVCLADRCLNFSFQRQYFQSSWTQLTKRLLLVVGRMTRLTFDKADGKSVFECTGKVIQHTWNYRTPSIQYVF